MSWLNEIISMKVFCKQKAPSECKVYLWLAMVESNWQMQNPEFAFQYNLAI